MVFKESSDLSRQKLGHPLHPAVVHFPITLFPLSTVFLILWWALGQTPFYLHAAYWSLMLGTLMVIPVLLTGISDMRSVLSDSHQHSHPHNHNHQGPPLLTIHVILGATIGLISLISGIYFLIEKPMFQPDLIPGFTAVSILLTFMVMAQGAIGGLLVYREHMGITHESSGS